ncbi:MAG: GTPase HflX [Lachnospiraceae bacterium]
MEEKELVILVGVQEPDNEDITESIDELGELADTAGAIAVGRLIQKREKIHPGTYIGKGKIEELKELIFITNATGIICDDELSPAQMNQLQQELDCKVMDRTLVILEIFAMHAKSREGKIQVELAQLRYRQARLVGLRNSLSRLGGGIGTRGPGEKKLEMDRRLIRERISHLKRELNDVICHRELIRFQRQKTNQKIAALVGYSSAGKSALLNTLTGADVLEEDKLFSTLDTTTRILSLPGKQKILLTDTVGFIRKLPHHLVEAFKSTLEEACYADILIHVVDVSNPQMEAQMKVAYETLKSLNIKEKPIITVFHKQDKLEEKRNFHDFSSDYSIMTSVKTGQGLEQLKETLSDILRSEQKYMEKVFDYSEASVIQQIRKRGELIEEEYLPEGILVKAYVPNELYQRFNIG